MPGSSQPQDLGSISYKDTSTEDKTQKIDSIETTASIVTETFQSEEKYYLKQQQKNNMLLQQVF